MGEPIFSFQQFSFQYNAQSTPTLKDINLDIKAGEKLLIAGPSGCGKSTLTHCLNGLIPFSYKGESKGSLTLMGEETKKLSLYEIAKKVGTVLQDSDAQFVGMTVAEDIAFALENDCVENPELHERVKQSATLLDVIDFMKHAPRELSGGQKQRVSIAGILVDDVEVLLFDEPLANLDPASGKRTIELIDRLQKETGAAIVIVEHRLEDVLECHVDRIVLMNEGRILADTTPGELLSGELLTKVGVREPLYVTALKYAGIDIKPEHKPESHYELNLTREERLQVKDWYIHSKPKPKVIYDKPLLEVKNLSFKYPGSNRTVLENISTTIYEGEMVAIVGTNGAGKSTFSKLICGMEIQNEGTLYFEGLNLNDLSIKERAGYIGYVMQNPNQMISKVMIYDEVALGLRVRGIAEEEISKRVEEALKICGLWRFRKWPISALSFGQKKRVTIASILVLNPKLLILDEPTAGQDFRHYTEIMEFLKSINEKGITIMMITHDMHLMLEYANRALVFSDKKIIADKCCEEVLTTDEIIECANLKKTSLFDLAKMCDIDNEADFVRHFIDYENVSTRSEELIDNQ